MVTDGKARGILPEVMGEHLGRVHKEIFDSALGNFPRSGGRRLISGREKSARRNLAEERTELGDAGEKW